VIDPREQLRSYPVSLLAVCPNSSFARTVIGNITYPEVTAAFLGTIEEVADHISDGKNSPGIGWALDSGWPAANRTFNCTSLKTAAVSVQNFLLVSAFSDQVLEEKSINTVCAYRPFAHPATAYMAFTAVYSFYYVYGAAFIGISSCAVMVTLQENRFQFLLQVKGLTNLAKVLVFLLCDFVQLFGLLIIATIVFMIIPQTKETDVSIFVVSYLFMVIALCFYDQLWGTIAKSKKSLGLCIITTILVAIVSELILQLQTVVPGGVIYLFNCLSPFSAFLGVVDLAMKKKAADDRLTWRTLNSGEPLTGGQIFAGHVINIVLWFGLMVLTRLCAAPAFGHAPIGWRNLFKIRSWKQLFRKRRHIMLETGSTREAIRFENLRKVYGKSTVAIDDLSMSIRTSEIVIAIGPNGSGKSTLLDTLIGAHAATSGKILVFGEEIAQDFSILYSHLGIVFQDNCLMESLSCLEHLQLFCELQGYDGGELTDTVAQFLSVFQLNGCAQTRGKALSGGEKRKLCIAITLISDPAILILDEPTAGVDAQSRQLIWKAISRYQNVTALISAHSLEEAESVSSRMVVMKAGKIAFAGTAAELRSQYHCGYNLTFLDDDLDFAAILNAARLVVPEAIMHEDHPKTLLIPADLRVVDVLDAIEGEREQLGFTAYTVQLENLEETLRKLIEDEEVLIQTQ
jgi:ABC-type multidrug transport system ATPase subunit